MNGTTKEVVTDSYRGVITQKKKKEITFAGKLLRDIIRYKYIYILAMPVILYYIFFCYVPMVGTVIAFKNYTPSVGIWESPWAKNFGFGHFINFFKGAYTYRIIRNTLLISLYDVIFAFPAPIIFALLLNEIRGKLYKRVVQTMTYLPHFISTMVVCGLIYNFAGKDGIINDIILLFGGERSNLLVRPEMFRIIFVGSNVWQTVGWGSIIYLAALSGVDQQLYEAAHIDGASKFSQVLNITIPSIMPTIIVMFILKMGTLLSVSYEKIILLYNPLTFETSDVISSYIFRRGLIDMDYSFSAAVGIFNSVVNLALIMITNAICKRLNETALW